MDECAADLAVVLQQDVLVSDVHRLQSMLDGALNTENTMVMGSTTLTFLATPAAGGLPSAVWLSPEDLDGFKLSMRVRRSCVALWADFAAEAATIVTAVCKTFRARAAAIDNRIALRRGTVPDDTDSYADINDYYGFDVASAIATHTEAHETSPDIVTDRMLKCSRCAKWVPGWDIDFEAGCNDDVFYKRLAHVAAGGTSIVCGECRSELGAIESLTDNAFFDDHHGSPENIGFFGLVNSGGSVVN